MCLKAATGRVVDRLLWPFETLRLEKRSELENIQFHSMEKMKLPCC